MAALGTTDRCGGDGRELTVQIGLEERPADDSEAFQPPQNLPEPLLRFDPAQDKMWMLVRGRKKIACDLDARMASLNGLLREGQVTTNESVDILRVRSLRCDLRETG